MAHLSGGHPAEPDPELARANSERVRARARDQFPLWAASVDSIVSADGGRLSDETLADIARLRSRARRSHPARYRAARRARG